MNPSVYSLARSQGVTPYQIHATLVELTSNATDFKVQVRTDHHEQSAIELILPTYETLEPLEFAPTESKGIASLLMVAAVVYHSERIHTKETHA